METHLRNSFKGLTNVDRRRMRHFSEYSVDVKILTGDNEKVTCCICRQVGLPVNELLLGSEIDELNDRELAEKSGEHYSICQIVSIPESQSGKSSQRQRSYSRLYG